MSEIEMNMLRPRAKKLKEITDEMWSQISKEHRELVEEYLQVSTHLSPQSKKQYTSGLRQFFYWVHKELNDKPLYKISKRDFIRYLSSLDNNGMSGKGQSFKKSSVSSFCNYIENVVGDDDENYKIFRNFTKNLPAIPQNQVYDKIKITRDEYELMTNILLEQKNYLGCAWLAVAFNVGARRSEILQFKTEILDYPVPEGQNYILSHNIRLKGKGTDGKVEKYMVNFEAIKYMKLWIENRPYKHEYIFTTKSKKQISESWGDEFCTNVLSPILKRRINPHIFKASCITFLLESGVDINLVSKYVAHHEDISTTLSFYDLRDFEEEKNQIF